MEARLLARSPLVLSGLLAALVFLALSPVSCTTEEPTESTYFDQTIAPILQNSCVRTNTGVGCHVADTAGNSLGNLDLSTFDGVNKRRDLLLNHGPYGQPSLLVKNVTPFTVNVQAFDDTTIPISTDIRHSGGPILETTQTGYDTIRRWIENGATVNNSGITPVTIPRDPCVSGAPPTTLEGFATSDLGFDPTHDPSSDQGYSTFQSTVAPFVQSTCAAGNCHGTSTNVMFLLCGNSPPELAWNFWVLSQYIPGGGAGGDSGISPDGSQLLSRPLSGGTFHEGGNIYSGVDDPNYVMMKSWVEERGPASFAAFQSNAAFTNVTFFAHRVQPIFVRKGCMMMQCHSPAMFHEYRLRGGTDGAFSFFSTLRNYTSTVLQLSIESDDVTASRLVRKNLFRPNNAGLPPATATDNGGGNSLTNACGDSGTGGLMTMTGGTEAGGPPSTMDGSAAEAGSTEAGANEGGTQQPEGGMQQQPEGGAGPAGTDAGAGMTQPLGITHRGGSLFEDFCLSEPSGALCDAAGYNYDTGDINSIPAFCLIREWHRRERAALTLAAFSGIAYVQRSAPPPSPDRAQDFDVFAPGAQLHFAAGTITATDDVQLTGTDTAYDLTKCGLSGSVDVRKPAVSWDASKLAFAARTSASAPLQIYEIDLGTMACSLHPLNTLKDPTCQPTQAGLLTHNFDPAYAPDGRLVFASTRGNLDAVQPNFDYCGPQRTPADPTKPNSNIYVYEPDPNNNDQPHLRQLTFVLDMERYPTFMSDGRLIFTVEKREPGFYQLALRRINLDGGDYHPLYAQRGTIGAYQATYPVELADKDFAAIFSDPGSLHGSGQLVVFNRSIGVDFHSQNAADYVVDPSVIVPGSSTYLEDGTAGTPDFFLHSLDDQLAQPNAIYTSPSMLPGGKILVSIGSGNPMTASGSYSVDVFDPENPTVPPHQLVPSGIEAVGVFARANKGVFVSSPDEPNGHTTIVSGTLAADITVLDMGLLGSLLFQNTPTGRVIEPLQSFDVYEELPADSAQPDPSFVATDNMETGTQAPGWAGNVFVKRRMLGTVPLASDRSTHFQIPGGVPIVLHLPDTQQSMSLSLPRYQREEMEFAPGEVCNQAMGAPPDNGTTENLFNGLCAFCHGSVSGQQVEVAVKPDILTQASMVVSRGAIPTNLNIPPASRPTPVGPPSTP
jgi:hypothetical protein